MRACKYTRTCTHRPSRARTHTHTQPHVDCGVTHSCTHAHADWGGGSRSEVHTPPLPLPIQCSFLQIRAVSRLLKPPMFGCSGCHSLCPVAQTRPVGRLCDGGAAAQDAESRSPEKRSQWHRTHCVLTHSWAGPGKAQRPVPVGGPASVQTQCSRQGAPCLTQRTQGHLGVAWAAAA